jgi:hypothetical protein
MLQYLPPFPLVLHVPLERPLYINDFVYEFKHLISDIAFVVVKLKETNDRFNSTLKVHELAGGHGFYLTLVAELVADAVVPLGVRAQLYFDLSLQENDQGQSAFASFDRAQMVLQVRVTSEPRH